MNTLAPLLAPLLPHEAQDQYAKCGRKVPYASIADATEVALRRQQAGAGTMYVYPCPYAAEAQHFHLSHLAPTPTQLDALATFTERQRRQGELEWRQVRRKLKEIETQIRATVTRFRRLQVTGCEGTPYPSRIGAHYQTLRTILETWNQLKGQQLMAIHEHDARVVVMEACRTCKVPGSVWRAVAEAKLHGLLTEITRMTDETAEDYAAQVQQLKEMEAEDLQACRDVVSRRYTAYVMGETDGRPA